jgi:hypothetical protein
MRARFKQGSPFHNLRARLAQGLVEINILLASLLLTYVVRVEVNVRRPYVAERVLPLSALRVIDRLGAGMVLCSASAEDAGIVADEERSELALAAGRLGSSA